MGVVGANVSSGYVSAVIRHHMANDADPSNGFTTHG